VGAGKEELTCCNLRDRAALPFAACQYEPARQQKARTRVRKMPMKQRLVRTEQSRKTKQRRPM